jgi:membrane associated rhomboid family serine protease
MTPTSVGMRCPECAGQRTQVHTMRTVEEPTVTYFLIVLNVLVFLGEMLSGAGAGGSFSGSSLLNDGAVSRPTIADGELWRLLTAGFLHAGIGHLLFNMFSLYILGSMLEPAVGRVRFAVIYFVSVLAGSFGVVLLEATAPSVGASGGVFGLMGAAIAVLWRRGINPMESGLGFWLGLNLLITFAVPNISIGGHLGGLAGGTLAALLMFEVGERARIPKNVATLLAGLVGALAVVGALMVAG